MGSDDQMAMERRARFSRGGNDRVPAATDALLL